MREIEFKGKVAYNDDEEITVVWSCGFLIGTDAIVGNITDWDEEYFCTEYWCKVIPETVGQYTGIDDDNKIRLYEFDIVEIDRTFTAEENFTGIIRMIEGSWMVENKEKTAAIPLFHEVHGIKFIGNIADTN